MYVRETDNEKASMHHKCNTKMAEFDIILL